MYYTYEKIPFKWFIHPEYIILVLFCCNVLAPSHHFLVYSVLRRNHSLDDKALYVKKEKLYIYIYLYWFRHCMRSAFFFFISFCRVGDMTVNDAESIDLAEKELKKIDLWMGSDRPSYVLFFGCVLFVFFFHYLIIILSVWAHYVSVIASPVDRFSGTDHHHWWHSPASMWHIAFVGFLFACFFFLLLHSFYLHSNERACNLLMNFMELCWAQQQPLPQSVDHVSMTNATRIGHLSRLAKTHTTTKYWITHTHIWWCLDINHTECADILCKHLPDFYCFLLYCMWIPADLQYLFIVVSSDFNERSMTNIWLYEIPKIWAIRFDTSVRDGTRFKRMTNICYQQFRVKKNKRTDRPAVVWIQWFFSLDAWNEKKNTKKKL